MTTANVTAEWRDVLTPAERRELLSMDDKRSWFSVVWNWTVVFSSMALVAYTPAWWLYPLTVPLALVLIGTRQLGFAVLMHEASHHSLFSNRRTNDWVGNWLCAYPVWSDLRPYRPYHLQHHAHTGSERDPDLGLVKPFPITRASMRRKLWRDLSGQTGWKQARAVFLRDIGWRTAGTQRDSARAKGGRADVGWHKIAPVVITNGVLFTLVALAGHPWLYLLWAVAWLTTNRVVTRVRAIAEHALTPDATDDLNNTRTTVARWWERLLIAPNRVNYHLEHHLLMTVPHYRLPRMHAILRERGVLDHACVDYGYPSVLRRAASNG